MCVLRKSIHLLDVVITQKSALFQLFASEYESLLIRWNPHPSLYVTLDGLDLIIWKTPQFNSFSCQSFHIDFEGPLFLGLA